MTNCILICNISMSVVYDAFLDNCYVLGKEELKSK